MTIHKENCPIYLANIGQWWSSMGPFCTCNGFTQSGGSNIGAIKETPKIEYIHELFNPQMGTASQVIKRATENTTLKFEKVIYINEYEAVCIFLR